MRRLLRLFSQTGKPRVMVIKHESLRMIPITMQERKRSIGELKRKDRARFTTPLAFTKRDPMAG